MLEDAAVDRVIIKSILVTQNIHHHIGFYEPVREIAMNPKLQSSKAGVGAGNGH